ncbi:MULTISPECIES: hypothetical protein [Streptomyces]|uniref:Uncharacterized protein n=2 Tax=Streptomyces TaxID=1883 RepID=A0ABV9IGU1_9ACTN
MTTFGTGARRALSFASTALVAGALGVAGTLGYQWVTAPDTSAVDAQAGELADALRKDLTSGFYSAGGGTYGGQFTEGTVVAQTEAHGGALLSFGSDGGVHTAEVMLGLVPPEARTSGAKDPAADAYPVRCYRYTFAFGAHSVKRSGVDCPTTRTDGRPGSLVAQLGVLLVEQPAGNNAYRNTATEGYTHTPQGVRDFLKAKGLVTAGDAVTGVSGRADGDDLYVVALRINGACHYLRMGSGSSSSSASDLIPLWTAPADEQEACDVGHAVAASALYGTDPAKEG